jgi:hypothetical protein
VFGFQDVGSRSQAGAGEDGYREESQEEKGEEAVGHLRHLGDTIAVVRPGRPPFIVFGRAE